MTTWFKEMIIQGEQFLIEKTFTKEKLSVDITYMLGKEKHYTIIECKDELEVERMFNEVGEWDCIEAFEDAKAKRN